MISRRAFTAGLAAIPFGAAGGFMIRHWIASGASIRFIGRNESMIALLDTSNVRILFLIGDPDAPMLAYLPQLLTVGRTRVDVIIASHRWLTTGGLRSTLDIASVNTISLQAHASLPPIQGNIVALTDHMEIDLEEGNKIAISVRPFDDPADPDALIDIACDGTRIILANRASALNAADTKPNLLALPGDIDGELIQQVGPALFLGTDLYPESALPQMQLFHNDSVNLAIRNGAVIVRENQLSS